MFLFYSLNQLISQYLPVDDRKVVIRAFLFAADAHEIQVRSSGEPYLTHPVAVACLLAEMKMDVQTLSAALLHDVIEDTSVTREEIEAIFGEKITQLIDGVTKLDKLKCHSQVEHQAENYKKMMLAMVGDIRVVMIKLADRLHNMSTLAALRPDKRRRIARETLEIYAPIAYRLGMYHIKHRFETLAFEGIYPTRYRVLQAKVNQAQKYRRRLSEKVLEKLQQHLASFVLPQHITERRKGLYSVYQRMKIRHMTFSEIMDVYEYKVVAKDRYDCYVVLGRIHEFFRPMPSRFKDYIALPKTNGYQALHTTVFGPHGLRIKVQIKSQPMNDIAEHGVAVHWLRPLDVNSQAHAQKWFAQLKDIDQQMHTPVDFIDTIKRDLFSDKVYVFTPEGEIVELPRASSCIDFAYHIHTDVGNHCIAAKVNRKLTPLSYVLKHGDAVEIIASPVSYPNPAWLGFATTSKARHAISAKLKQQQQNEILKSGKQILTQQCMHHQLSLLDIEADKLKAALKHFNFNGMSELYINIGQGEFLAQSFVEYIEKHDPVEGHYPEAVTELLINRDNLHALARCCYPIPDDEAFGYFVPKEGLEIHRASCVKLTQNSYRQYQRIVVRWGDLENQPFLVRLVITLENIKGAIAQTATCISRQDPQIVSFEVTEFEKTYGVVETTLEVTSREQIDHTIRALQRLKVCLKVERLGGQ